MNYSFIMVRLDATSTTCVSLWDNFHMIELVRFYLVVGLNTYLSFFFFLEFQWVVSL